MSIHIFKTIKEVLTNPENYEQCIACDNPVDKRHLVDGCPTCGGHYYNSKEDKDFSHLKEVIPPEEELEV